MRDFAYKRLLKILALGVLGCLLVLVVWGAGFAWYVSRSCPVPSVQFSGAAVELPFASSEYEKFVRGEENSVLTVPEWYIVYASDEYGRFIAQHIPSRFAYFHSVKEFWCAYKQVSGVASQFYPKNSEYLNVLRVIGVSLTFENTLKGLYEHTVGAVAEFFGGVNTPEDRYAAYVAQEYGSFLHTVPWYEFDFVSKLKGLWKLPVFQGNFIRKVERRAILSVEYGIKAVYGKVIKFATKAAYGDEELQTLMYVRHMSPVQGVSVLEQKGDVALISMPRYEAVTQLVPQLTEKGVEFLQIAGNDEIVVSVLLPGALPDYVTPILSQDVLDTPDVQRMYVKVKVQDLHTFVKYLKQNYLSLEHVYDY